jgi:AraC-like DNA-binding protein
MLTVESGLCRKSESFCMQNGSNPIDRNMDALSEALGAVRMTGAIFFNARLTAPWGFSVPPVREVASVLAPGTELLVNYHLIASGQGVARVEGMAELPLVAGDILILPHGDAHTVRNGSPARLADSRDALCKFLAGDLVQMKIGGGGEETHIICGFFGCDRHAERLFLAGLPRLLKLNIRGDPAGDWLEASIRHLVSEAGSGRPGRSVLLSKMAEALFVETLRRYMEQLPEEAVGWLAAARDPIVGRTLALLHREAGRAWTLEELAAAIGASRSVLVERFGRLLGEPPLTYLTRWRMQLAAQLLQTTDKTILQLASEVGYESEAAFNRAFKREFGTPPAQYRRKLRAALLSR